MKRAALVLLFEAHFMKRTALVLLFETHFMKRAALVLLFALLVCLSFLMGRKRKF
jgi:hypothetical protein